MQIAIYTKQSNQVSLCAFPSYKITYLSLSNNI